jgi:hypothetical protein
MFGWYMFVNVGQASLASPSGKSVVLLPSTASKETTSDIAKASIIFAISILCAELVGSKTVFFLDTSSFHQ